MLSNTLVTNEIKDAAGAEVEFERISTVGRTTIFQKKVVTPGQPHILTIKHEDVGSGKSATRRSLIRFDLTSENSDGERMTTSGYMVVVHPEGLADDYDDVKMVLANLMSFVANTGADTTIKFDCTGNGAQTILNATL